MIFSQETLTILIGLGSLATMIVTVVMAIKGPQMKSQLNDAVFDEKFKNLEKNTNDKIVNTHEKIDGIEKMVANLRDNHIHTIESKLDKHIQENQQSTIEQARWQSRIETLLEQIIKK